MSDFLERTRLLIGTEALARIRAQRVFIAGVGGVGAYAAEALARAGVGFLTLHDADVVTPSNLNRQLVALRSTLGRKKVVVMRDRIADINPECVVEIRDSFMRVGRMDQVLTADYTAVVDAIDVLNCKLDFLTFAYQRGYRLYASMGAGNRIDPTRIQSGDLFDSRHCRLAKVVRKKLRKAGIERGIQAVWSSELGYAPVLASSGDEVVRPIQGTISTIPALFGLTLAGLVLKDIVRQQ
jgi:tRNA threonylcarbamoyladenosine dehydratase